jgi:hypothetical protein
MVEQRKSSVLGRQRKDTTHILVIEIEAVEFERERDCEQRSA